MSAITICLIVCIFLVLFVLIMEFFSYYRKNSMKKFDRHCGNCKHLIINSVGTWTCRRNPVDEDMWDYVHGMEKDIFLSCEVCAGKWICHWEKK